MYYPYFSRSTKRALNQKHWGLLLLQCPHLEKPPTLLLWLKKIGRAKAIWQKGQAERKWEEASWVYCWMVSPCPYFWTKEVRCGLTSLGKEGECVSKGVAATAPVVMNEQGSSHGRHPEKAANSVVTCWNYHLAFAAFWVPLVGQPWPVIFKQYWEILLPETLETKGG